MGWDEIETQREEEDDTMARSVRQEASSAHERLSARTPAQTTHSSSSRTDPAAAPASAAPESSRVAASDAR